MVSVEKEIQVIVRVPPDNDEIDVSLPLSATARDVIQSLLDSDLGIRRVDDEGNLISYDLVSKAKNATIDERETLGDARVQQNDILLMVPNIVAGSS